MNADTLAAMAITERYAKAAHDALRAAEKAVAAMELIATERDCYRAALVEIAEMDPLQTNLYWAIEAAREALLEPSAHRAEAQTPSSSSPDAQGGESP